MNDQIINRVASICTIIWFAATVAKFLFKLLEPLPGLPNLMGLPKLQTILLIGFVAAAAHAVLWSSAERFIFHSKIGAGGGDSLPQGWSAAVLSLTMTIPLVLLPPLYERLSHTQIVLPRHLYAACFVVVFAAIGHIFLYGAKVVHFPGVRNLIFPVGSGPDRRLALLMESVYAVIHFGSTVLIYRIVVDSRLGSPGATVIYPTLISASVWLSGVCVSIFLKYPDSLVDKRSIEVRGIIHALMLVVSVQGGMLM
jgi:hypothetical protein